MQSFSLNIRGHIREFSTPQVMGILNVTPDSFYACLLYTSDAADE